MALSKKSITGLGTLLSCAVIAISGFLVVKPSFDQAQDNREELEMLQVETESKTTRLGILEEGVENYDEIRGFVDTFLVYAPGHKDVESASRAISTAVVPGTSIVSFTFGDVEPTADYPVPEASVDNSASSGSSGSSSSSDDEGGASAGTFQRMPVEITVTSSNYENLSEYLDSLAQQERLITVLDVNSSGGNEGVNATINGYAFIYTR